MILAFLTRKLSAHLAIAEPVLVVRFIDVNKYLDVDRPPEERKDLSGDGIDVVMSLAYDFPRVNVSQVL